VKTIEESVEKGQMDVDKPLVAAYSIWAQLHGIVSVVSTGRLDSRINKEQFIEDSIEHVIQGFLVRAAII